MKTNKSRKTRIDPKDYAQIIKGVELREVYLESCSAMLVREKMLRQKKLAADVKDTASYVQNDNRVKVTQKYNLRVVDREREKEFPLKMSCVFSLTFTTEIPFTKKFFDVFRRLNLPLNSWPYFREFVQNMTQRMNIPPLTLPFVRRR